MRRSHDNLIVVISLLNFTHGARESVCVGFPVSGKLCKRDLFEAQRPHYVQINFNAIQQLSVQYLEFLLLWWMKQRICCRLTLAVLCDDSLDLGCAHVWFYLFIYFWIKFSIFLFNECFLLFSFCIAQLPKMINNKLRSKRPNFNLTYCCSLPNWTI